MRKITYVTRSVSLTLVDVTYFKVETSMLETVTVRINGNVEIPEKDGKQDARKLNTMFSVYCNGPVVKAEITGTTEQLYGVPLDVYMENAVRLDPKTRKPIDAATV